MYNTCCLSNAQDGSDLSAGDLKSGSPYSFRKVGGNFFLDSAGGLSKFFGDGSDGALVTTASLTLDSTLNGPAVIKQYSSINIAAGHTLTVSNPCQGLILYSQGDVTISGTIDMSKKAGLAPNGNIIPMVISKYLIDGTGTGKALEKFLQLTTRLYAVKGGAGGNGGYGGGYNGSTGRVTSVGAGGIGRFNLGGFGGGGSGGSQYSGFLGGVGGSINNAELGGGGGYPISNGLAKDWPMLS